MTKEEAITELSDMRAEYSFFDDAEQSRYHALSMAIEALNAERWILCSERLPKDDDWQIVTILDERGDTPYKYSDFGWYLNRAECWIIDAEQRTDVIAWMPMPEPYTEEK